MYNCPTRWYTVGLVDEMSVDELSWKQILQPLVTILT